jgi:hypothetical protein
MTVQPQLTINVAVVHPSPAIDVTHVVKLPKPIE